MQILGQLYFSTTKIDLIVKIAIKSDLVTISIVGPYGKWFGVAFGAKTFTMSDQPYTIMVDGSGKISELKKGQILAKSVKVLENKGTHIMLTRSKKVLIWKFSINYLTSTKGLTLH